MNYLSYDVEILKDWQNNVIFKCTENISNISKKCKKFTMFHFDAFSLIISNGYFSISHVQYGMFFNIMRWLKAYYCCYYVRAIQEVLTQSNRISSTLKIHI